MEEGESMKKARTSVPEPSEEPGVARAGREGPVKILGRLVRLMKVSVGWRTPDVY